MNTLDLKVGKIHDSWSSGNNLRRSFLLIFLLLVFSPLVALVIEFVQSWAANHSNWLWLSVPTGRRLVLLIQSLGLALCVALGTTILGFFAAICLWRWHRGAARYLRWFVLLLFIIPPYVHALAWISLVTQINSLLRVLGLDPVPFQGWFASWWIQFMALTPIAIGMTLIGLESVDPDLIGAARLVRPDIHSLMKVALPLAKPLIVAGGGFVFLLSLTDYSVPSLFHLNVYPLEIFAEYSASSEPSRAFLLAIPFLLITILVLAASQMALRNAVQKPLWHIRPWPVAPVWPEWLLYLQRPSLVVLASQVLVPLFVLIIAVGSWENMIQSITSAHREIVFTLWFSAVTAIACIPLAFAPASQLLRRDFQGKIWWLVVTLPLAVPAPLIGIGLIAVWNRPFFSGIYGSEVMPILANLARFVPLAALALLAQLRRIDPILIDAARVYQTHSIKTWIQIRLPMLAPGLLAAGCIVFALSAGELAATLMVAPPGQATLTMRIYNYLHYGASESVAGLCLMMMVLGLIVGLISIVVLRGWLRFFMRRSMVRP